MVRSSNGRRAGGFERVVVAAVAAGALAAAATGCLQILGDEGPFVLATGGSAGAGATGGTGASGGAGGAGGTGSDVCIPDDARACYSGPIGTEGIGTCKSGTETCTEDGKAWGPCVGEVVPQSEDPSVPGDEACDGYAPGEPLCALLFGDSDMQAGKVVVSTPDGNAIIAGSFSGAIALGSDVLVGEEQIFVAKVDGQCHPLWAAQLGGAEGAAIGSIAVDGSGDVYVAGAATAPFTVDMAGVTIGSFVVKLDAATGMSLWGTTCETDMFNSVPTSLAVDDNGFVIVGGHFSNSINCGTGAMASSGGLDAFVAKLDSSDGTTLWAETFGYATVSEQRIGAVDLDPAGNVVLAGVFRNGINLGGGNLVVAGDTDIFVAKLTTDGQHLWSKQFGGGILVNVADISVDGIAGILVTGYFNGTINLPGIPDLMNGGEPNGFVFKLNASGTPLWGWGFGPESGQQSGTSVTAAPDGTVVLTGSFQKDLDLNGTVYRATGSTDGFIAKLVGEDGSHVWSRAVKDSPFGGAAVTTDGTITASGSASAVFDNTIDFGTGPVDPQGIDAFVVRLAP